MNSDRPLRYGVVGTGVAAVCRFTPVLVLLLGIVGLSTAVGWLDDVLLPALALAIGVTAFAVWRRRSA